MIFEEENKAIEDCLDIVSRIEKILRKFRAEYQSTLKAYEKRKAEEDFDTFESEYLQLLAKYQKAIRDTSELWDRAIANLEGWKQKKKEKTEYFLTGVLWAMDEAQIDDKLRKKMTEEASRLSL
jgi:hypothetical protein